MHIALIANDTTFVYNLRRDVLQRFAKEGYKISVIGQVLAFKEELEQMGCTIVDVQTARHGKNPFADLILFKNYYSALKKMKPDVVFTNNIKPNVYAGLACKLLRIRYIPNITGLGTPVEYPGPMQALTTRLYKLGVSGAEAVFFQNSENEQFFRDRGMLSPKSKAILLPGSGVNLQSHPVMPYPQGDEVHFLFIARVMKEKGIDLYLAAAKRIREKYPNAIFHICGGCDDPKYTEILAAEQNAGNVIYHGQQKDMTPFFAQAGCVVHPSYYPEGMSNVLLEAAACGRPIIATDRSGCRETVDDGKTGFVIPIKNEDALVGAIERILAMSCDQRRDMGLAGRAKMEREFDREIVAGKYVEGISK